LRNGISVPLLCNDVVQVVNTHSVSKQYNLVLAEEWWCYADGKV